MKKMKKMNRKGFTLIELLIVIAILGILVSLILPRFADVRDDANVKVCVANLRGLVSAMNIYEVKENVSSGFTWGGSNNVAFLQTSGYLAGVPQCPIVGPGAYTLSGAAGSAGAVCSDTSGTHVWP
ncbi:MAG: prepilin-type N-terminal cleavage/methylation domain-containing protein [Candidatus Omnitrophota bacterium]